MNKFKIGDKVKVIDSGGCASAHIGDIGIIFEIKLRNDGTKLIRIRRIKDGFCYGMYYYRFVLVDKKIIKPFGIVKFMEELNV